MKNILVLAFVYFCLAGVAAVAGGTGDTAGRLKALGERIEKMAAGKPGEFARELVDGARTNMILAQSAFTSGNDPAALRNVEMAEMQLLVADAKTAEKEAAEETALRRAEVKKLEGKLERYLQGEDQ